MSSAMVLSSKPLKFVAMLAFLPFVLSGCLKFTMDLEVSPQDTISGVAVVALSNELAGLADADEGISPFADVDGVTESEFDDGSFVGSQYEFSGVPIERLSLDDESSELRIERDGDNLIVSGSLSFEDEESTDSGGDDFGFGEAFFDSADIRISITFPGDIRETNGEIDEATNTITWYPQFGETNEISALVYSPRGLPLWVWWTAGGALFALVVASGIVLFLRGRSSRAESTSLPIDQREEEKRDAGVSDSSPPTEENPSRLSAETSRSDSRPIFSYRVRDSLLRREWFELKVFPDALQHGFVKGKNQDPEDWETIPISSITAVSRLEDGFGVRVVHDGEIDVLPGGKADSRTLVGLIESLLKGLSEFVSGSPSRSRLLAAELRELAALRDEGLISEAEFIELKAKRIRAE